MQPEYTIVKLVEAIIDVVEARGGSAEEIGPVKLEYLEGTDYYQLVVGIKGSIPSDEQLFGSIDTDAQA